MIYVFRVVPRLFFAVDNPQQDPVTAKAKGLTMKYMDPIIHDWYRVPQPPVYGLSPPYHVNESSRYTNITECNLSRIVAALNGILQGSVSKHLSVNSMIPCEIIL